MDEPLTHQRQIVDNHFRFIDRLGTRLRNSGPVQGETAKSVLSRATPGLQALFDSLVTGSPTARAVKDRTVEEWNPLSQRILLSDETPIFAAALERDFTLVPSYVQTFVEWAHEAVHILSMEPWFLGARTIRSQSDFTAWYRAAEGMAFWYADIVVTREVRDAAPTADLVYCRSSVSNAGFHPEQAFRALGLVTSEEILPLYIAGFLGDRSPLSTVQHPLSVTLAERIHEFYIGSDLTLRGLYDLLASFDVFGEFFDRFCQLGAPGLFDEESLARVGTLDPAAYHVELGVRLLPALEALKSDQLAKVRLRRSLQTRAYYGWFLARSLSKGWVVSLRSMNLPRVAEAAAEYLNDIEAALRLLVAGAQAERVIDAISQLDAAYQSRVRAPLEDGAAHMRYRYWIFPFFAPTGGIVGLWDERTRYSRTEAAEVARFVFERSPWSDHLVEALAEVLRACRLDPADSARAIFNGYLMRLDVINAWSPPLACLSPAEGRYREVAFEFH